MDRECTRIQEHVVEAAGELDGLSSSQRRHLELCASCRMVADAERGLHGVLAEALPPADLALQRQIVAVLAGARWRRRVLAFFPVAASLMVAMLGVAMIGGVPGSSLLGLLPAWSSLGWLSLARSAADWQLVASALVRSLPSILPTAVQAVAWGLALLGVVIVAGALRSWRKQPTWSSRP